MEGKASGIIQNNKHSWKTERLEHFFNLSQNRLKCTFKKKKKKDKLYARGNSCFSFEFSLYSVLSEVQNEISQTWWRFCCNSGVDH